MSCPFLRGRVAASDLPNRQPDALRPGVVGIRFRVGAPRSAELMYALRQTALPDTDGRATDVPDGPAQLNIKASRLGEADLLTGIDASVSDLRLRKIYRPAVRRHRFQIARLLRAGRLCATRSTARLPSSIASFAR